MERKQWMENARDKVPAVTGLVFLLLCLWLTWAVALPFWQNGQKDWARAAGLLQQREKVEVFARQYDPGTARTKRKNTAQFTTEAAPKDGMEAMGKISALAERTQVQVVACRPRETGKKQDHLPMELTLVGDYVQLLVFFRQWKEEMPLAYWETGHIERETEGPLTFHGTVCFMRS